MRKSLTYFLSPSSPRQAEERATTPTTTSTSMTHGGLTGLVLMVPPPPMPRDAPTPISDMRTLKRRT